MVLTGHVTVADAKLQVLRGIEQLSQVFLDTDSRAQLENATDAAGREDFYRALKSLRTLLAREERLLAVHPQ